MSGKLGSIRVGMNLFGDLVMHCEECQTTFSKKEIQDKTVISVVDIALSHQCEEKDLEYVRATREIEKRQQRE